jgi:hypothetical protein
MAGLCDRHIAHQVQGGLHQKYDPDYVLARSPKLIVLNTRVMPAQDGQWYHPGYWAGETALVSRPDFQRLYRPIPTFWTWHWVAGVTSYIVLYERMPGT